jgi:Virulence-associated protein E/Primase C terminal 2 (PriCT-2)
MYSKTVANATNFFEPAIAEHFRNLHRLAKVSGHKGILVLSAFGEDLPPQVRHFQIGEHESMTAAAMAFRTTRYNVYCSPAIYRSDLPATSKGGEADVIASLAPVTDSDADKGKDAPQSPMPADYVMETSPGNAQQFLFLSKALTPDEAKPLCAAMKRATKADGASELSHVFRVPGTLNWPNKAKLARGRSPEPFLVRVTKAWDGNSLTDVDELRAVLEPHWQAPRTERLATVAGETEYDFNDAKALYQWMADNGAIDSDDDWRNAGMAAKSEFGESGLELWEILATQGGLSDESLNRWKSFKLDSETGVGIRTLLKLAHDAGWTGSLRRSNASMFQGVAQIAAAAGASLPPPLPYDPAPTSGMPLTNTAAIVADLGRLAVETFIKAQSGKPATDAPRIPDAASTHPLFDPLNRAIAHIVGDAERAPKAFRASNVLEVFAVLSAAHEMTFAAVAARIRASGAALPESKLTAAVRRFEGQVKRETRTGAGWATDDKGMPDSSNTDNTAVFIRMLGAELRFNGWTNRQEIRYSESGEWTPMQEKDFNFLLTTAGNGQYQFRPRESMFKRALSALAHEIIYDPVLERLVAAQGAYDGVPRLDEWLAMALGVPNDAYLTAVGRNLLGGICKRVRRPGCKHDETVILMGPEDTFKSTFCRVLAMDDAWFTDSVDFSGSQQNVIPQLFGRVVVELAELDGMAKREVTHIKRFLSGQSDNVTLKYEAFTSDHARRCIMVGTSNEENPLSTTVAYLL